MECLEVKIQKKLNDFMLDLEFTMDRGVLGVLGASGSGKSVSLKSIAGILTPDTGRIVSGKRIFFDQEKKINIKPQKRRVGYLFQDYALFPNMTVSENIACGIRDKRQGAKANVSKWMERFQLNGLGAQYPGKLSGGQKQRAALARILISEPDILLLDEPFSAMDSFLKEELQIELLRCLDEFEGAAIIVSHDRDEIYKLCSQTMIVDKGRNLICKDTRELFLHPEKMEAARLTGCKNISRAVRTGTCEIEAVDYGVRFQVSGKIPEKLKFIGIRAHDFISVASGEETGINEIKVCGKVITDAPFERNILFKNAQCPRKSMWMKVEDKTAGIPDKVSVAADKILLLE